MTIRDRLPDWLVKRVDDYFGRQGLAKWEPEHCGLIYGRNGFGQHYVLQRMSAEPEERRWHLYERRPCPHGRWACTCAHRLLWTGSDPEVGKTRADGR